MAFVLVIEDEAPLRENLVRILQAQGHRVIAAENGEAGLARLREAPPDLVICDILMPGVDGYGVLAELRARPGTAAIPFIFVTASAGQMELARGLESGADAYVTKPFRLDELAAAVESCLARGAGGETSVKGGTNP